MRVLAVDPGTKHIGIALSDPTGSIASPLTVIRHISRLVDAAAIAQIGEQNEVSLIVVGQALDADDQPTPQSRSASRLAEAIRSQTDLPVELWDESGSTQAVLEARLVLGASRKKRSDHYDDLAAAYMLQTYLEAHR